MKVRETVALRRPREEVYRALVHPDRREGDGWSALGPDGDGYAATLHAHSGPMAVDFDCRFRVAELEPGNRVRLQGVGVAPRMGFTARADLVLGESDVRIDADVAVSGTLAGLGQRELAHQARRLLASYIPS
jgi:carbon monoxide dehydrogenase subunit G